MDTNKESLVLDYFRVLEPIYDEKSRSRKAYNEAIDQLIIEELGRVNGPIRVLDAGSGTGTRAEGIKAHLPKSVFFGCDLTPEMVRSARSRAVYREVKEASITDLPFADRSFDAALCLFNTLGYLGSRNQREKAVSEFSRVLTDNGVLILDVMNAWHLGEGLDYRASLFALVSRWFKGLLDLRLEPGDLVFSAETTGFVHGFTRWEIERHLGSAGFLVRESRILGYDSGKHKKHFWEGQFFYVAQRTR